MSQNTNKHIGVKNILYFIYFSNQGLLGNMVRRTLRDVGKALKICFWGNKGDPKKITSAKNINVLIGENQISYSRINGSENDFMDNLYDHVLLMFGN